MVCCITVINVKSITAWILHFNKKISFFLSRTLTPHIFCRGLYLCLKRCIAERDGSYFLWLLFTLSTAHGQRYVPHERWFRNIHKDEGPVNDEAGSFTVWAQFEVLLYGDPAVAVKPLTCAGLTAQVGEIQYLHNFATGVSFAFCLSRCQVLSH